MSGLLIVCAYLLGSIPTGYLIGLYLSGIDIREHGSGSTGATNVLRTVGKGAALAVLIIDVLKGAIAIFLVKFAYLYLSPDLLPLEWKNWLIVAAAFIAVLGHSKSVWLNFAGGKSAAISLGVLLVMNPLVALGTLSTFLTVLGVFKIVSLSSISGAIAVSIFMVLLNQPLAYIAFGVIAGIYVIIRHSSNIQRLIAGNEPRLGQKVNES